MINILLIEDEFIISRDIKMVLEKESYANVTIAYDVNEAIAFFESEQIDVVISDINLNSDVDGIQVVSKLLKVKKVPVVYLTAYSDDEIILRAEQTSPFAYLIKPYNENQLKITINLAVLNFKKVTKSVRIKEENTKLLNLLTSREKQVLIVLAEGKISKEIATTLNISRQTVEKHKQNIKLKLNLRNIGEMVHFAMTSKLLEVKA